MTVTTMLMSKIAKKCLKKWKLRLTEISEGYLHKEHSSVKDLTGDAEVNSAQTCQV